MKIEIKGKRLLVEYMEKTTPKGLLIVPKNENKDEYTKRAKVLLMGKKDEYTENINPGDIVYVAHPTGTLFDYVAGMDCQIIDNDAVFAKEIPETVNNGMIFQGHPEVSNDKARNI